jgi:aerobic-type carbon monoxide dehydrogenase small subunit (CoxS/CutS family)
MDPTFALSVNGQSKKVTTNPDRSLLEVLREDLQLTGTKYGCGEGQCGACTVLVDDKPTRSCITPVRAVAFGKITTIEGLETNGKLHPVQQAFLEEKAFQCAYCTSGMIMGVAGLLSLKPVPTDAQILSRMEGHLCRCGTYPNIVKAIRRVAAQARS